MTDLECAYVAGFLDGDGSIIFQIVRRHDYRLGFQIRASVCFYQKSCARTVLEWLKTRLKKGYLRNRGVMADYTIVGYTAVRHVLHCIRPYVVVKRTQLEFALKILDAAERIKDRDDLIAVAKAVDQFATLNYSKKRSINAARVLEHLGTDAMST